MRGMLSSNVTRLQRAQNAAARVVVWGARRRSTNSFGLLKQLHWLPIESRIKFKIACITYKTVSTAQPAYLHSVLKQYAPSRRLRSSYCSLLAVPPSHVFAHALALVVFLQLIPPHGTLFLFKFVTVPSYLVSAVNSKLFSII